MERLWCWRCRAEVPMLDEVEWPVLAEALTRGIRNIQAWRTDHAAPLAEAMDGDRPQVHYARALATYERITGVRETNPLALWHHRLALYGPPCRACGRPLRTPHAALCASCGAKREPAD